MKTIRTTAPIDIEELKKYFVDPEINYLIDYKNSKLQGSKLLTYLSNLDIPCDIDVDENTEEFFVLLKEYFNSPFLLSINTLERAAIDVLMTYKGLESHAKLPKFIEENLEIIEKWSDRLDSLTLFNMYMVNIPEFKEFAKSHTRDPGDSLVGINFVSLLKHPDFYDFYQLIEPSRLKYYEGYFNDYMFKGKNLFSFWSQDCNPYYIIFVGIANGVDPSDYKEEIEALFNA